MQLHSSTHALMHSSTHALTLRPPPPKKAWHAALTKAVVQVEGMHIIPAYYTLRRMLTYADVCRTDVC